MSLPVVLPTLPLQCSPRFAQSASPRYRTAPTFHRLGALSPFNMNRMHPRPSDVTHAPYRREPYIRVQLTTGTR